jgi:hypothetical protein
MRQQTNKLFTASFPFLILPFQFFFHSIPVTTDFRPLNSYLSLIDALSLPGIEPGSTGGNRVRYQHATLIIYIAVQF